jgi:LEA14-like dessication related protein
MTRFARLVVILAASAAAFGCAGLRPALEPPTVMISSFRILPSSGVAPRFEIGLHIVNPNPEALDLQGIVYTVTLEGRKVLTGAKSDLPTIGAYGEGDVTLTATTNLLGGINLFASLMNQPRESIAYELEAKLDIGGFRPRIQVREAGQVTLPGGAGR